MADSAKLCPRPQCIAVGSHNPVKVASTQAVFTRLCRAAITVQAVEVESGVPAQPWGDEQTRRGAIQRALEARRRTGCAWGIGFEGGLLDVSGDLYTSAWCAVVGPDGRLSTASGENLLLPPAVAAEVRRGVELGTAIDHLSGARGTKRRGGAIGVLTDGLLTRTEAYEHLLMMALAPFLTPHFYEAAE